MEQLSKEGTSPTEEENATTVEVAAMDAENTEAANTDLPTETQDQENTTNLQTNTESTMAEQEQVKKHKINLLYEQSLGFIPSSLRSTQDPRYVYAKFSKNYKHFDYTHEEILQILEETNLLKYLQLLQISKPNKSIDVLFRTEDAAEFFIHILR